MVRLMLNINVKLKVEIIGTNDGLWSEVDCQVPEAKAMSNSMPRSR